jgi:ABC-type branched-subunit amino acid transport system substrate-binding protein
MITEARIPLLGMFTGANALREPFNPYLINIRPSYYRETESAVRHLVQDLGLERFAVFYQYDAYGFDGLTGTELALKEFGLSPVARSSYTRGTIKVEKAVREIVASDAQAVFMIGSYNPCAEFVRQAASRGFHPLYYTVSFVGAEELARRLQGLPQERVIMSQVVPSPLGWDSRKKSQAVREYTRLLQKYHPQERPNFVGLEGYINARVLVEGLRRCGRDLSRKKFISAIESIKGYTLGDDMQIEFGPKDHQGLKKIYFTLLKGNTFVPITDWDSLKND